MSPDRPLPHHAGVAAVKATERRHDDHRAAQTELRESIAWWAGWRRQLGDDESTSYRRFYKRFGIDVYSAQSLNTKDSLTLTSKIWENING
jgi:hypothetical protein